MPVPKRHNIAPVSIDGTLLGGNVRQSIATGTNVIGEASDGEVYPRIKAISGQRPGATWDSVALAEVLNAVPILGVNISAGAGLVMYAQQHEKGGTRTTGATQKSYTINDGMAVLTSLSCDHQGNATVSCEAVAEWDGTAAEPLIINDAVALPVYGGTSERFSIAQMTLGGVALDGSQSLEIDFGVQLASEGADSDLWPTHVSIDGINSVIRIRGISLDWFSDAGIPLIGRPGVIADTEIYLQKRKAGSTYVDHTTPEHIYIQAQGLVHVTQGMDGAEGGQAAECAVELQTSYDGINVPVIINTASAIPNV